MEYCYRPMFSGRRLLSTVAMLALSMLVGILGGGVLGAAILSFANFVLRVRAGGSYVGPWKADVWFGCLLGGEFGVLAVPIAYITLIRKIGMRKAWLPGAAGTLVGGFVGALVGPLYAALVGIAGFFVAIKWAVDSGSVAKMS